MGALGESEKPARVDALIITAIKEEFDELLKVDAGASPGSRWDVRLGPTGLKVAFRTFLAAKGGSLSIAVAQAAGMGGVETASVAGSLIAAYSPQCIAMCGVCAGRRGEVNLGDVLIADRVWMYDAGKLKVEIDDADKSRIQREQGDIETHVLRADWKQRAEDFTIPPEADEWLRTRPRTYEAQANWILERLVKGEDPRSHADRASKCPDYGKALSLLWKQKWVKNGALKLTASGRKRIDSLLHLHPDGLPEPAPFKVHVGPIGSGNKVIQDAEIFDRLSASIRKVLGVEMEAAAVGAVAHVHRDNVRYMVVMKGVMDHADELKSDNIKTFAARASAECLIAFLRANLPPLGSGFGLRSTTPRAALTSNPCSTGSLGPGRRVGARRSGLSSSREMRVTGGVTSRPATVFAKTS